MTKLLTAIDETGVVPPQDPESFWQSFYADRQVWSGEPNPTLVRHVETLTPGTALDLGCGEGADAIWLAARGWRVTAVDISPTALERAAVHAREAGVGDLIDWQHHDLEVSLPSGRFDLVSAQYFHSPVGLARVDILRKAALVVRPGGRLLISGHAGMSHDTAQYPAAQDLIDALDLGSPWVVEIVEELPRSVTTSDGRTLDIVDATVLLRR